MKVEEIKYRDCNDPDELAAAVAAGVRVEGFRPGGEWWGSAFDTAEQFSDALQRGVCYRLPSWWTPEWQPPAPPPPPIAAVAWRERNER